MQRSSVDAKRQNDRFVVVVSQVAANVVRESTLHFPETLAESIPAPGMDQERCQESSTFRELRENRPGSDAHRVQT